MKLVTVGNTVFLDGKQLPPVPHSERGVSVATDDKKCLCKWLHLKKTANGNGRLSRHSVAFNKERSNESHCNQRPHFGHTGN